MNYQQEQMMMEMQADMMQMMMTVCRNKTQKTTHSQASITDDERKQFTNCVMKFMEAPMHLQQAMSAGQMWARGLRLLRDTINKVVVKRAISVWCVFLITRPH